MKKNQYALEHIRLAKQEVDDEIARHIAGQPTVGSLSQLKAILQKLNEMEYLIMNSVIPPKSDRDRGMGRMISDSWPLGSTLGEKVLVAEESYLKLAPSQKF